MLLLPLSVFAVVGWFVVVAAVAVACFCFCCGYRCCSCLVFVAVVDGCCCFGFVSFRALMLSSVCCCFLLFVFAVAVDC